MVGKELHVAAVINNAMLEAILAEIRPLIGRGKVADYIPALASVSGDKLGIAISTVDGQHFAAGDAHERFSIQSISKVLSLVVAMNHYQEEEIWQRVGKDPSGQPFNSLCSWRSSRANRETRLSTPGRWWSATCCRAGSAPRVSGCWRLSAA
jgi:glutaminase